MPSLTDDITIDKAEEISKTTGLGFTKTPDGKIQLITPPDKPLEIENKDYKKLPSSNQ